MSHDARAEYIISRALSGLFLFAPLFLWCFLYLVTDGQMSWRQHMTMTIISLTYYAIAFALFHDKRKETKL